MEHVEDRLAALEAELASLRAQVAAQRARPASPPATAAVAEEVNRRALIRKGGLALAGAAAGGAALLVGTSSPAGAADGGNVIIGATNLGTTKTILRTSGGTQQTFELDSASSTVAPLRISQQLAATPVAGAGDTGSLGVRLRSSGGADLWFAHLGDDKTGLGPITWGRVLTSAYANYTLFESTPQRKADTRSTAKPVDNSTSTFTLSAAPATAVGCIGTITITDTTSPGSYASVYNGNLATIASPGFSHVNADANQSVATTFSSALGAAKSLKVYVFKSCHVIIDISAWIVVAP